MLKGTDLIVSRSAEGVVTISLRETDKHEEREEMLKTENSVSVIALLVGSFVGFPAAAQTASDTGAVETVVVTGIRGSLERSLDVKRNALGLVDAISMEDIGKFPDSNLAEALMRIPGVTISRAGTMGGMATTGQATEITVRGFGPAFNETLFDGREIPSANGGRAFDFSGLSADMVSALEVYKSPDSSLSAGAIGATVNVKYPKPFDKEGLTIVGAASTSYAPNDGRFTPTGNFLVSDTFFGGKVGVLVAGAYSKLDTTQYQVSNWGWIGQYIYPCQYTSTCTPTDFAAGKDLTKPIWFTQDLAIQRNQDTEERQNARVAVQFQPTEHLLVTLDGNYARDTVDENELQYAIWNNGDEMRNVKTSSNGTIVDYTRSGPSDFSSSEYLGVQQTYDVGLNVKYDVDNHLTLLFDFDQSLSSLNPGDHLSAVGMDVGYGSSTGGTNSANFEIVQPGGHSLPYYKNYGPNGDESLLLDTAIMGSHITAVTAQRNRNMVNQVRAEATWTEENLIVKFGGSYIANHYHMSYYDPFADGLWQAWSGYGPDSGNATGVHMPSSIFKGTVSVGSIPGWNTVSMIPGLLKYSRTDAWAYLESLGIPTSGTPGTPGYIPGFNWGCCLVNGKTTYTGMNANKLMGFDPGSFQQVFEDTYALYASVSTDASFAGMPLKVNAAARYEYTSVKASGIDQPLTGLAVMPGDPTAYLYTMGDETQTTETNSYQYLLPNIDLNLQVTDDFHLRFDASRTLTRPNLNDLKPNKSGWGGRKDALGVSGGNPQELPYLSDNVDISAEWYYAPNSYAAADVFVKSVSNFVVGGSSTLVLDGTNGNPRVIDPNTNSPAVFTLSQNVNGPTANVYGIELAWQHMFGDSGFGYQINGTIVQSDKPYDPTNLTTNAFAVAGLADSANFVTFYDKNGFEIRFAANWRDTYIDHFGQGLSAGTMFGAEPVIVNGTWTLDASTSYDITDNINVYFEANNLMDVAYSTRGRFTDQVLDVVSVGRRFTAGVHFKL